MQRLLLEKVINLLLTGEERAEVERQKLGKIVEMRLNALGIDPEILD
ncbi:MAG: hypothetical protein V7K92_08000 [Nostoc sp.]